MTKKVILPFKEVRASMLKIFREDFKLKRRTIKHYSWQLGRVKQFMDSSNIEILTPEVCDKYMLAFIENKDITTFSTTEKQIYHAISLLKHYLVTGVIVHKTTPIKFEGQIGNLMMQYVSYREKDRLSEKTIYLMKLRLYRFFDCLTVAGITKIEQVDLSHIITFLNVISPKYRSVASHTVPTLRSFFRYLYSREIINTDLGAFIPRYNYSKQPRLPSTYTSDEVKGLISSIDRSTKLGKRDYAIVLLAAMLGLRASDISNLKFENISWEQNTINLIQYKTQKPLELPLLPEVGNAIIDYLKHSRPKSNSQYVFLIVFMPHSKMGRSALSQITQKYFKSANINTEGKHAGIHCLRHSLATTLLEERIGLPVISEVLGHSHTNSTNYYLRIDIQSLRKCSLDVPPVNDNFYIQKGGYFYE